MVILTSGGFPHWENYNQLTDILITVFCFIYHLRGALWKSLLLEKLNSYVLWTPVQLSLKALKQRIIMLLHLLKLFAITYSKKWVQINLMPVSKYNCSTKQRPSREPWNKCAAFMPRKSLDEPGVAYPPYCPEVRHGLTSCHPARDGLLKSRY